MQFSVDFDFANSPSLGQLTARQQADVLRLIDAAAETWSRYLASSHDITIGVRVDAAAYSGDTRARGRPEEYRSTFQMDNFVTVYWGTAQSKLKTGVDTNSTYDIIIDLTPDAVNNLLFFSQNPYGPLETIPTGKTDAMAVFLQEIGHALGIASFSSSRTDPSFNVQRTIVAWIMSGTTVLGSGYLPNSGADWHLAT